MRGSLIITNFIEKPHRLVSNARQNENRMPRNKGGMAAKSEISGFKKGNVVYARNLLVTGSV